MSSVTYECRHGTVINENYGVPESPCLLCFAQSIFNEATSRDGTPERDEEAMGTIAGMCRELIEQAGFDPDNDKDGEEESDEEGESVDPIEPE